MTTHDVQGRPYARMSALRPGDKVIVDDGFTCMKKWSEREVLLEHDALAIRCRSGLHFLDGQLAGDGTDVLIGIYHAPAVDSQVG